MARRPLVSRIYPKRTWRLVYKSSPLLSSYSSEKEKQIDELIYSVFLDFDFTPVFGGDSLKARLVATDIYSEVLARAKDQSELETSLFTVADVKSRWKSLLNSQIESLLAFKRNFETLL